MWQMKLAELERRLIGERIRAGVKAAEHRGVKLGRKSKLTPQQIDHACKLVDGGDDRQKAAAPFRSDARPFTGRLPGSARLFQMNLHRGFRRVFAVLWVLYGASVVMYPFYAAEKAMDAAASFSVMTFNSCIGAPRNQGLSYDDQLRVCSAESRHAFDSVGLGTGWKNLWMNLRWHLLWALPVVLLVPPLIVYGVIWLLLKIGLWVARGFRESPG